MSQPIVQAMVLADRVYRDAATGKYLIIGTFNTLKRRLVKAKMTDAGSRGPESELEGPSIVVSSADVADSGTPSLYMAFTNIRDHTTFRLRFASLSQDLVIFEGAFDVRSGDPVSLVEVAADLPRLQGPAGQYSLDLLLNGSILAQRRVTLEEYGGTDEHSTGS
jgi:hypothetical protein